MILSVSQITKFDPTQTAGCERRWWFNKVQGVPEPPTANQAEGTRIHAEIEAFLKTGVDSLGPIARAGLHLLPKPGEDLLVEHAFDGVDIDGIPLNGRIDLMHYRGEYLDPLGELRVESAPEVVDFKTTADLKYARPASSLIDLPQMIGYAWVASLRWPNATAIRISHIYFQKSGKKAALKSTALIPLATVKQRWQGIRALAARMRVAATATKPDDVAPNFESCSVFGGCSFRHICPKPREQTLNELFKGKGDAMSLLDKLRSATTPQAPNHVQPVTAPLASPDAMRAKILAEEASIKAGKVFTCDACGDAFFQEALLASHKCPKATASSAEARAIAAFAPLSPVERDYLDAKGGASLVKGAEDKIASIASIASRAFAPCLSCGETLSPLNTSTKNGLMRHVGCKGVAVTPPDAPKPAPHETFAPLPPDAIVPEAVRVAAAQIETPSVSVEAKKPRRSKTSTPSVSVAIPNHAAEVADFAGPSYTGGLRLFVDCVVEGEPVSSLEVYINNLLRNLEASFKVTDIRAASGESPLGFGRWKGILAALVRAEPPPEGAFFIRDVAESEVKQVVVDALKPSCRVFVRGL